jgi:type II secretory pathway predicted ATPase ExeA
MSMRNVLKSYGLKWNPFGKEIPEESLVISKTIEHFVWRVEQLVDEGGFALVTGEPGTGKSATMRILSHKLRQARDGTVVHLDRPQSTVADFYRELGDAFGVQVGASNRWGGFKTLRERWRAILEATLLRPVLLVDEAQEVAGKVVSEIRILSAEGFDSRSLLTVVFAGDGRFPSQLRSPDLLPLDTRIRARLTMQVQGNDDLINILRTLVERAGNPRIMTDELMLILVQNSHGNLRALMNLANDLLLEGHTQGADVLDEKLYFALEQRQAPTVRPIDTSRRKPRSRP